MKEIIEYQGWKQCVRLSNGTTELIVTTDVGPRILRYGFIGGFNMMKEYPEMMGRTGDAEWLIYGGHRLWHAPEAKPRSYFPDNTPVQTEWDGKWLKLISTPEDNGIQKTININLAETGSKVKIIHTLTNTGLWAIEAAPWALTVMAPGGKCITPFEPFAPHSEKLTPEKPLVLWSYTNMGDKRWTWGNKYFMLQQDSNATIPQKIGALCKMGWTSYLNSGTLLIKQFPYLEDARYPDFGCNFETFTNQDMLEVESVGPLTKLEPGASVDHTERWFLHKDVPDVATDDDADANILPRVQISLNEIGK